MSDLKLKTFADVFLLSLKKLGVDYLFTTPGPEFAFLSEVYSRQSAELLPKPMIVPHEALAMSMAHGYYLATKRASAVLSTLNTGAANGLVHLMAARAMNIPIMFISGQPPIAYRNRGRTAHVLNESSEPSGIWRESVKWHYDVKAPSQIQAVLQRGWEVMHSQVRGPVSLSLPSDILLEKWDSEKPTLSAGGGGGRVDGGAIGVGGGAIGSGGGAIGSGRADGTGDLLSSLTGESLLDREAVQTPSAQILQKIHNMLIESSRPLVITSRSGLDVEAVGLLEAIAERYQVGVLCPNAQTVNIRSQHPCFLGFHDERLLKEADLILILDTPVPWIPAQSEPSPTSHLIHIGPDPLFENLPMRSFRSSLNVRAEVCATLKGLLALAPAPGERTTSAWVQSSREALEIARKQAPLEKFNPKAVGEVLSENFNEQTVIINESSLPTDSLFLERPGSYFRTSAVIGWSMGCALGYKLGQPNSLPIAVVGDGAYYLSQPLATQWVALNRQLPILTVVLNDGGANSTSRQKQFSMVSPSLPFAEMAKVGGAAGTTVTSRDELQDALTESLTACQNGQLAVIDARI